MYPHKIFIHMPSSRGALVVAVRQNTKYEATLRVAASLLFTKSVHFWTTSYHAGLQNPALRGAGGASTSLVGPCTMVTYFICL
jgi:hypothetical protein